MSQVIAPINFYEDGTERIKNLINHFKLKLNKFRYLTLRRSDGTQKFY